MADGRTSKLDGWRNSIAPATPTLEPYYQLGPESLAWQRRRRAQHRQDRRPRLSISRSLGAWRDWRRPTTNAGRRKFMEYRRTWVRRHPNIAKFWTTSVRQAVNAIENGETLHGGAHRFLREGQFLHLELPSGRRIRYPFARIYADEHGKTFTFRDASGGRWEWYHVLKNGRGAFGGLIAENATQALCRDIFVDAMLRLEIAGYAVSRICTTNSFVRCRTTSAISIVSLPSSPRRHMGAGFSGRRQGRHCRSVYRD